MKVYHCSFEYSHVRQVALRDSYVFDVQATLGYLRYSSAPLIQASSIVRVPSPGD